MSKLKEVNNYEMEAGLEKRLKETLPGGMMQILSWQDKSPFTTVNHGDLRLDNWYFNNKEGKLEGGLYDWALAVRGPCWYDIAWMLSHSFNNKFQTDNEEDLLYVVSSE